MNGKKSLLYIVLLIVAMWAVGAVAVYATPTSGTTQDISLTEITPTYANIPTDGIYFANDGASFLHVKNTYTATVTITVVTPATFGGLALADKTFTVTASTGERMVGPFPPTWFNEASGTYKGKVKITCSPDVSGSVSAGFFSWE